MFRVLQGITEEVKKQAEQRISGRFIMCVPGVHVSIENIPKGVHTVENLQNRKNSKRAKVYLDSAQKLNCGTIAEGHFNEQYRTRMREQGYTQTLMEESNRIALERKNDVATPEERPTTETDTRSCNPHMEEAATP